MKKSTLFLGLLTLTTLSLVACGTKDYTMTFDEAYDISKQSTLQDIILNTETFEQSFNMSTNVNAKSTKLTLNLQANSKQDLENTKSESTTKFDGKVNIEDNTISADWVLDLKLVNDVIYLNLQSLNIVWSQDTSFISAMVDGFKNQRYSLSMEWLGELPSSLSYLRETNDIDEKVNEIIINEWSTIYEGKFAQFHGYNARKFSLDNEKLQELINDYYSLLYTSLDEEYTYTPEIPQVNIQDFEWYLVITWKNKVTTVVDNMSIDDATISLYSGKDFYVYVSSEDIPLLEILATKKMCKYKVSANMQNIASLNGTISPRVSSSKIKINFNITLDIVPTNTDQPNTIIPLKGNRTYKSIPDFNISVPEESQDLSEILSSYLWGMMWWDEYNYDYEDYEDYDYESSDTLQDETE